MFVNNNSKPYSFLKNRKLVSFCVLVFGIFVLFSSENKINGQMTVDRTDDTIVTACTMAANDCTFRGAIANLNIAMSGTIDFDPVVFATQQTIVLTLGELVITSPGIITGPGADLLTISGNNSNRVFSLSPSAYTAIQNLTVSNGNGAGAVNSGLGGGIYSEGIAFINNLAIDNNQAVEGGGIYNNNNQIQITGTAITRNTSSMNGGGIFNFSGGYVILVSSTVSGNTATTGNGGGIVNEGTINPVNSTIVNNSAPAGVGGGSINSGTYVLNNSIQANNSDNGTAPDGSGSVISNGFNLFEDTTGTTITLGTTDIGGQDPNLGPLQNNGGPSETHAILPGSPAIDSGQTGNTTDQRGMPRPIDDPNTPNPGGPGDLGDIGAFEVMAPSAAAVTIGGRVFSQTGAGVPNALVQMMDQAGGLSVARTNSFGYYAFKNVEAGQTLIFTVFSKEHQFSAIVITVQSDTKGLDFHPLAASKKSGGPRWSSIKPVMKPPN